MDTAVAEIRPITSNAKPEPLVAFLICEGSCGEPKIPRPTVHAFVDFVSGPISRALMYACNGCGTRRVWGTR